MAQGALPPVASGGRDSEGGQSAWPDMCPFASGCLFHDGLRPGVCLCEIFTVQYTYCTVCVSVRERDRRSRRVTDA